MTQTHPKSSVLHPLQSASSASSGACSVGTVQPVAVYFEVVLKAGTPLPVPGWILRLWPQARLGDATLEAIPEDPARTQAELLSGLRAQGIGVLGPVRRHV